MRKILFFALLFIGVNAIGQTIVKGRVLDMDTKEAIPFSNIYIENSSIGTTSNLDGSFIFSTSLLGDQTIIIQSIGYANLIVEKSLNSSEIDLGDVGLKSKSIGLEGVDIVGIADIAKDRKTPVAVSTIKAAEIQQKLGSQEFPEILNNTPSVYATKQGGGYGDARINIRGFSQENIAVMINGVPVNDMENGAVYWSNWAGLSDVTTAMQVQRGLGSSKLAISSVGGTINILTKTTDAQKGGKVGVSVGNDGYNKFLASYSTGLMSNNLAVSFLMGRTTGKGYALGTDFEGYNYFLGLGYELNSKNDLQFTLTGAPQIHNQRTTSFFNMATLDDYLEHGEKYNYNYGTLDGKDFNWRQNFYHKPITSLNWDHKINEKSSLSTVVYASFGRGGGTGDLGRLGGNYASSSDFRGPNGEVMYDSIAAANGGEVVNFNDDFAYGNELDPTTNSYIVNADNIQSTDEDGSNYMEGAHRRNGAVRRASMNSHNWFGTVINFKTSLTDHINLDIGIDARSYKGFHYRRLNNLLGSDGYRDNSDVNNPMNIVTDTYDNNFGNILNVFSSIEDETKVNYYNVGKVKWLGGFTQLEYSKNKVTVFVQGSVSSKMYQRVDYFKYEADNQESDKVNIMGGNIKGGMNVNLDERNNMFFNTGYYSKQPGFDAVFLDNANNVNPDIVNEKVFGLEYGYGFRSLDRAFVANVNFYYTTWKDRYLAQATEFDINDSTTVDGFARIEGVREVHSGVEFDAKYKVSSKVKLFGMLSIGDWHYEGNASGPAFDENQEKIGDITVYLDGVKVGNAAQTTARIGIDYEPIKGLRLDANWRYVDRLYARLFLDDFQDQDHLGSLELPSYNLVDAGISYRLLFGDEHLQSLSFRVNVNNLFDEVYLSDSATNRHAKQLSDFGSATEYAEYYENETYKDIDKSNKVFFGFGRTWNFGVSYSF